MERMSCIPEYGKNLGKSLYEFRLRHTYDEIVAQHPDSRATPHGGDAIKRATCPTGCSTPTPAPAEAAAAENDQQDDDQNDPTESAHDSSCHIETRTGPHLTTRACAARTQQPAA